MQTTMTTERLSGFRLMNIHYQRPVDYDAVAETFAEKQRNLQECCSVDPEVFEEA